jgi:hypothetical protein
MQCCYVAHLNGMLRTRWLNSRRALNVRAALLAGCSAARRISWSQNELISATSRTRRSGRQKYKHCQKGTAQVPGKSDASTSKARTTGWQFCAESNYPLTKDGVVHIPLGIVDDPSRSLAPGRQA